MMLITVALIFIILGILIKYAKMYYLIAGYSTMSKEKQEKYDIEGIATVFRNGMFGMAIIMLLGYGLAKSFDNPRIEMYAFWTAIIIGIPYLLIVANLNKYKIKKDD